MSSSKNVVGGSITNKNGVVAIGDNIVIQQIRDKKLPKDYLADLPALPKDLTFPAAPYCGLRWFSREEARIFFGRGDKIKSIYDKLCLTGARSVTLLHGQSGVGKSSLLHAGLLPRLESNFTIHYLRRDQTTGIFKPVQSLLKSSPKDKPLLFILDQLEEIITQPQPEEEMEALELAQLIADNQQVRWLLSFRKEFLAEFSVLLEGVGINPDTIYLEPLQWANVLEAVEGVSIDEACQKQYGLSFETGVAEAITHDIMRDVDAHKAPALQILLLKLWRIASGQTSRHAGLEKISVQLKKEHLIPLQDQPKITARHYELLVAQSGLLMDDFLGEQINLIRTIKGQWVDTGLLLSLLYSLTTEKSTAKAQAIKTLNEDFGHAPNFSVLLQELRDRYLITDVATDSQSLRLAHDALAPLVRARFSASQATGPRAQAILESRIRHAEKEQTPHPFDHADLAVILKGTNGMRKWTPEEQSLIQRSRQRRKKSRTIRNIFLGLLFILTCSLCYTGWQTYQGQRLQEASRLERNADNYLDPLAKLQTYQASLAINPNNLECQGKLYATYRQHLFPKSILALPNTYTASFQTDGKNLVVLDKQGEGHSARHFAYDSAVDSFRFVRTMDANIHANQEVLNFSTDGETLISGGNDHIMHAWRLSGTSILADSMPDRLSVSVMAVSPSGRYVLAGGFEQSTLLFRDLRGELPARTINLSFVPRHLLFLSETDFLAGNQDGKLLRLDLSANIISELTYTGNSLTSLAWDHQNETLALGDKDGQSQFFSYANQKWTKQLHHQLETKSEVQGFAFSSFNSLLAVIYQDGIELISRLNSSMDLAIDSISSEAPLISGTFQTAAFSDHGRLLTFSKFEDVKSWPLNNLLPLQTIAITHQEAVGAISHQGELHLVSGTFDENLKVWQLPATSPSNFGDAHQDFRIMGLSTASNRIISADQRGRLLFFDDELKLLNPNDANHHDEAVMLSSLSRNGQYALSYGADQQLKLWDAQAASMLRSTSFPSLLSFAWSPQSDLVALLMPGNQLSIFSTLDWSVPKHQFTTNAEISLNNLSWISDGLLLLGGTTGSGIYDLNGVQKAWLPDLSQATGKAFVYNSCIEDGSSLAAIISADRKRCFLISEAGFSHQQIRSNDRIEDVALCGDHIYLLTKKGIELWPVKQEDLIILLAQ